MLPCKLQDKTSAVDFKAKIQIYIIIFTERLAKQKTSVNLFSVVFHLERIQCEPRDLENPSIVNVAISAGQVTVRLEHRLVQIKHSLLCQHKITKKTRNCLVEPSNFVD